MRLIVGLGNPGDRYALTRHNVGWWVLDKAAGQWAIPLRTVGGARRGRGCVGSTPVTLAAPLAWMNQVGPTVNALMGELACVLSDLLVIHDDLDLPLGRLRIKRRGGAGGHNGVRSVIDAVGAEEFCRLKIGIGRPAPGVDPAEYVLSSFVPSDIRLLDPVLAQAVQALECWAAQGVEATMNRFNVREKEEGDE